MVIAMIVMRILHVGLGVFWAGALIFAALFLEPSVRAAGPEGGKVMQALLQRGFLNIMPVVAFLTIVSGIGMYSVVDPSFRMWMFSGFHFALAFGGLVSIVAFVIGVFVMRPTVLKAGALAQAAAQVPEGPGREAQMAEAQRLRRRAAVLGRVVAGLLSVTVLAMAVARYV
ncbi:MAG TPA: hypothetical protein VF970_01855 [Gemmatimonadales bacterium]